MDFVKLSFIISQFNNNANVSLLKLVTSAISNETFQNTIKLEIKILILKISVIKVSSFAGQGRAGEQG